MSVLSFDDAVKLARLTNPNDAESQLLETMVDAADEVIESIAGPVIPAVSVLTGRVLPSGAVALPVRIRSLVSVNVDGAAVDVAKVDVTDAGVGVLRVKSGAWRPGQYVTVTAQTGPARTPAHVVLAAQELVKHWWSLAQSTDGALWVGGDGGFSPSSYAVPRRVRELLDAGDALPGFA